MSGVKIFHGLQLLRCCGGGAYGEVYFAKDISGRELAVKIVSKQKLGDDWHQELKGVINYRKLTEQTADLLQIFHVEEDEDSFFYTMEAADTAGTAEYVPDTLAGRLKNGPLPAESLFDIIHGIFTGIKTIHEAGFVHRDIKPDNILFVKCRPKLGDIGLLSSLNAATTQLAGTMDFLPPELRTADGGNSPRKLSQKQNDLYAFGKVIYCAVTGMPPNCWPTIPVEMPLTPERKFLQRLAFRLCAKDPAARLDSLAATERELAEIRRKLICGETFRDKAIHHLRSAAGAVRSRTIQFRRFCCRHWLAAGIAILLTAGGVWYRRPPYDIAGETTKIYRHPEGGFTMTIPQQWEVLSNKNIRKRLAAKNTGELEKLLPADGNQRQHLLDLINNGVDFIYCDFDRTYPDNLTIQSFPVDGKALQKLPDEELRIGLKELHQGKLGAQTEIYDFKRLEIAGVPCIFADLSHEPKKMRSHNYLFILPDKCVCIVLGAKLSTFAARREQFSQIIKTVKF